MAVGVKSRSMARTVPGLLDRVPSHDAPKVRTERRPFDERAVLIAIHGELFYTTSHDSALAGTDFRHIRHFPGCHDIDVLRRHIEVFSREVLNGTKRFARRIVELCPWIAPSHDQIGDEDPGDRAVRHSIP